MGFFADLFSAPYNAISGGQLTSWQIASNEADNTAMIQGTIDAACTDYDDATCAIAQSVGAQNIGQLPSDASSAASDIATSNGNCAGLKIAGCCIDSYEGFLSCADGTVKIALAIAAALTGLYVFITFGPAIANFLSRRK